MSRQRRARGDGSIQRNEDGTGWIAIYELPRDYRGKRRRKKRRARTRVEAQRFLREMRNEYDANGRLADRNRSVSSTVADYLDVRRSEGLATSTMAREERFATLIAGYFSNTKVTALTVEDCDRFLEDVANGLPDRSGQQTRPAVGRDHLRRLRATFRRAIRNDVRLGRLTTNVADLAELPADNGTYKDLRALTVDEFRRLLDVCDGVDGILIDLIGRHGLRPAEARALTWQCLDLENAILKVRAQMSSTNESTSPKTARATRTIRLHPDTVEALTSWHVTQLKVQSEVRSSWADLDLVLATNLGTAIDRNNFNRSLRRRCGLAGVVPIAPYELRHTAITHQCQQGYHAWQVADWAGTSEKMIYLHYRHLLTEVIDVEPVVV